MMNVRTIARHLVHRPDPVEAIRERIWQEMTSRAGLLVESLDETALRGLARVLNVDLTDAESN